MARRRLCELVALAIALGRFNEGRRPAPNCQKGSDRMAYWSLRVVVLVRSVDKSVIALSI